MEPKEQDMTTKLTLKDVGNSKDTKSIEEPFLDEYYTEIEEISSVFNKVQAAIVDYENLKVEMSYEEAIRKLKKLEQSIIHYGMFSPNEDYTEVATENIKYMLIPFYLSDVFGRMSTNRKTNLSLSKLYMDEFIKLINHYGLLDKQERKKWKEIFDNANYEPTREEKIGKFKERKAIETKIKELETMTNEENQREIMTLIMKTSIIRLFENVRMTNLELEMQNYKEKIEKEKQTNPNYKEDLKPIPKMKVWQIEKPEPEQQNPDMPRMISNGKKAGLCHQHAGEMRQDMMHQVFQPGGSQPTMTLAEFADIEIRNMQEQERNMKKAAAEKAKEKDNSSDEEVNTKKQREARGWDDWKDDNEKGSGNRNGR